MRARARTACTLAPGGSTRDSYAAKGRSANLTSEPREPPESAKSRTINGNDENTQSLQHQAFLDLELFCSPYGGDGRAAC